MKTLKPYINGPDFKCTALFAGTTAKGPTTKTLALTVYYNCETKTVLGVNSLPEGASMNYQFDSATGESVVTVDCPADTDVLKYLAEGESATCTKDTGKFSPTRIKGCGKIHIRAFTVVDTKKTFNGITAENAVCGATNTGKKSKAYVEDMLLNNYEGDVCGWEYVEPSCFGDGSCTHAVTCEYNADTEKASVTTTVTRTAGEYATFNLAEYKAEHAKFKVPSASTKLRFWNCDRDYSEKKKRSVEEEVTEVITVQFWENYHLNKTIYDPVIEDEVLEEIFSQNTVSTQADTLETLESKNVILLPILAAILLLTLIMAVVIVIKLNRRNTEALTAKTASFKDPEPAFSGKLQFAEA